MKILKIQRKGLNDRVWCLSDIGDPDTCIAESPIDFNFPICPVELQSGEIHFSTKCTNRTVFSRLILCLKLLLYFPELTLN